MCETCMCLARGGVGGESVIGVLLGFANPVKTCGMWDDVCIWVAAGWVGLSWIIVYEGWVTLCLRVLCAS